MATPLVLNSPKIQLSSGTVDLKCHARQLSVLPDQEFADVSTFCNPGGEAPGQVSWTLSITALQSFAADGLYNTLSPLQGTTVDFDVQPDDVAAISVTNPKISGTCYVPIVPLLDAGVGETSELDIEFKIVGSPTVAYV